MQGLFDPVAVYKAVYRTIVSARDKSVVDAQVLMGGAVMRIGSAETLPYISDSPIGLQSISQISEAMPGDTYVDRLAIPRHADARSLCKQRGSKSS